MWMHSLYAVKTKILKLGASNVGENPKINNIFKAFKMAKYDLVWIMDSNVYVDPNIMSRTAKFFDYQNLGLVHHLPVGKDPKTFGSALEACYLNLNHSKFYTFVNYLQVASCVNGKSNMYRKSDLITIGGLGQFGKYIAEDNAIGQRLLEKGLLHAMTADFAIQSLGGISIQDFIQRRIRWTRLRKYISFRYILYEPLSECFLCGLFGGAAFQYLLEIPMISFFIIHFSGWLIIDMLLMYRIEPGFLSSFCFYLAAWIVRETMVLPLWMIAIIGTQVDWRGKNFALNPDGTVSRKCV